MMELVEVGPRGSALLPHNRAATRAVPVHKRPPLAERLTLRRIRRIPVTLFGKKTFEQLAELIEIDRLGDVFVASRR